MKKQILVVLVLMVVAVTLLFAQNKLIMGVYLHDMSQMEYDKLGIKDKIGVMVDVIVKDGPSDLAGIKAKDVILKIDGEKIRTSDQVSRMFYSKKKGQDIDVELFRDGAIKNIMVALSEKEIWDKPFIGVYLADLSNKYYIENKIKEKYGILIKKVVEDSPAHKAGLEAKDILMKFDGEKIYSDSQLVKMLKDYKIDQKVKIDVMRDGEIKSLKLKLGERTKKKEKV